MLHLQMEEMRAEEPYRLSHYRLRRFSGWARAALESAVGLIALGVIAVLAFTVWNAAHSEGLIIESFRVPPDLAARGLTGEVMADQVLDRLSAMQAATNSGVANQSYSGGSGDDIKVEIPETGISIGELYRFLRRWLGRETHISGDVVRNGAGLAVTVRAGTKGADTASGAEADLDALLQKTAENIYRRTQPYLYVRYIIPVANVAAGASRVAEARAILAELINSPSGYDRAIAWNELGIIANVYDRNPLLALEDGRKAIATEPRDNAVFFGNMGAIESNLGHAETALADYQIAVRQAGRATRGNAAYTEGNRFGYSAQIAARTGDFGNAFAFQQRAISLSGGINGPPGRVLLGVQFLALQHDAAAAAAYAAQLPDRNIAAGQGLALQTAITRLVQESARENWTGIAALVAEAEKTLAAQAYGFPLVMARQRILQPALALARARLGDIAGAQSLIAATPADCYDCIRTRGRIASEAKQWARADWWFARAVADAPSIPMAHEDWGRSLLARGKPDEAIAQFTLANKKGPHFADALEGWGEALIAKSQSHLALAKFAEAEKYAPNWGRLHLKWGEALVWAGKKDDARKQFARAAELDLTPSEKAELARRQ